MDLSALTQIWVRLRQELVETHQLTDEDDPWLEDTLDGEAALMDRLRYLLRKRRELLANCDALKTMIRELSERQNRMDNTAKRIGDAVVYAMQEAGISKLKSPDFSASVSYGKAPIIGVENLDPDTLPPSLVRIRKEIDKVALRQALESGETIENVYLGNAAPFITVRKS
jgi:hypothetical protein